MKTNNEPIYVKFPKEETRGKFLLHLDKTKYSFQIKDDNIIFDTKTFEAVASILSACHEFMRERLEAKSLET